MDQAFIDEFAKTFKKKFSKEQMDSIKSQLSVAPDEKKEAVMGATYKSPYGMSWIAWLLGDFGVDRFMLGDTKKGIITLLFCWSIIPWIISWWTIEKRTRKYNYDNFVKAIS